jgi:hypothetical protein
LDTGIGKAVSVLNVVGIVQTTATAFSPKYADSMAITNYLHLGVRFWFIFTILCFVGLFILTLQGANRYKKQLERRDNIEIVYDEHRHRTCKVIESGEQVFSVGFLALNGPPINDPIIFPSQLVRCASNRRGHTENIPIDPLPLTPIGVKRSTVAPSAIPSLWYNVFRHKEGSLDIQFCYDSVNSQPVLLPPGTYILTLVAQGTPSSRRVRSLFLTITKKGKLSAGIAVFSRT